jgi:hypothetical protein
MKHRNFRIAWSVAWDVLAVILSAPKGRKFIARGVSPW